MSDDLLIDKPLLGACAPVFYQSFCDNQDQHREIASFERAVLRGKPEAVPDLPPPPRRMRKRTPLLVASPDGDDDPPPSLIDSSSDYALCSASDCDNAPTRRTVPVEIVPHLRMDLLYKPLASTMDIVVEVYASDGELIERKAYPDAKRFRTLSLRRIALVGKCVTHQDL